jgi:hypothetical protein
MTAPDTATTLSQSLEKNVSETSFHTLPDPKNASTSNLSDVGSLSSQQPDAREVSALNDKLINAINLQTSLDDTLQQTKHELAESRKRITQLEAEAKTHEEKLSSGLLVTKDDYDQQIGNERSEKSKAQQAMKDMQAEMENLSVSLFEDANERVATANKEKAAMDKKNQQLRDQIKEGETLLASQAEQLLELKKLMQHTQLDAVLEDTDSPRVSNAPSSPELSREDSNIAKLLEAMNLTPTTPESGDYSPAHPTSFHQLLKPMCRSDVPAYEEFRSMVHTAQKSHAGSRMGSGTYNMTGLGLGPLTTSTNASSTSLTAQTTRIPITPTLPGSFSPTTEVRGPLPLKDTKFFKRLMLEDIEPTLRLDLSQSISWLQRRSITTAFAESSLIVEPIPEASRKLYGKYTSCALCGEYRKADENPRTHRMRVNEGENATKWSLCGICLEKVRGVGDLVGYVRMIRDGVVKCGDKTEELEAWDELVRLRERLFWARMAGGVVPSFVKFTHERTMAPPLTEVSKREDENNPLSPTTRPQTPTARSDSASTDGSQTEAALQLKTQLDDSLTTFDNLQDVHKVVATPPNTPPRPAQRESGGFPRINIPSASSFFQGSVNVLR